MVASGYPPGLTLLLRKEKLHWKYAGQLCLPLLSRKVQFGDFICSYVVRRYVHSIGDPCDTEP